MPPPPLERPRAPEIVPLVPAGRRADAWMVTVLTFFGRHRAVPPTPEPVDDVPVNTSSLDGGLRDIRQTDPGFDPSRFAGYAAMVFRDVQRGWMARDLEPLRDRVTPEMHGEMQAQCERWRGTGRVNRVAEIDVTATVTEAWQERGRDYLTAHIGGSIIDYTIDETRDDVVDGSRTIPGTVEEFWTFARPAGFNFWMLSAIQT